MTAASTTIFLWLLAVPLIPRHAGGGDGGRQAEVEKRLEWLTQSAGGAEERLWRMSELGGELTGGHDDALRAATEECDGRRAPASPEQLEEEERDNAYDKAGFLSFMEFGGFDLGQAGY